MHWAMLRTPVHQYTIEEKKYQCSVIRYIFVTWILTLYRIGHPFIMINISA